MRTKETIMKGVKSISDTEFAKLEVLIDIRDVLIGLRDSK